MLWPADAFVFGGLRKPAGTKLPGPEQAVSAVVQSLSDSASARLNTLQQLPGKYYGRITAKTGRFNRQITARTSKALRRLQRQEEKINRRLAQVDSLASRNMLTQSIDSLSRLRALLKNKAAGMADKIPGKQYIPYLDTLKNSLEFLDKYQGRLKGLKALSEVEEASGQWKKLQGSLDQVRQLEGRLDQLQNIQQYIAEQQEALAQSLSGYGDLFNRYLGKFGKEAYYYQAQIRNYKEIWQHPDRVEAKALDLLHEVPAFSSFMKAHSMLAGLFRLPENYGSPQSLEGLQTRAMVEREIRRQVQAAGADGSAQIRQQMAMARQQVQQLKEKLPAFADASAAMPDFKPKALKSKTFAQRLEYGANVQFGKADKYFPATSDIAAQVAYKFSEKGSAGVGAAFKLGWGSNIRKIRFTARGLGLRSFLDYRIKGSIYANGGFEFTHEKTIPDLPALKEFNGWTGSALLGIARKYKVSDKLNGHMMLLFDFLYKQHVPRTQPILFRVGYNF